MKKYSRESKQHSLLLTLLVYVLAFTVAVYVYRAVPENYSLLMKTLFADIAATIVVFIFSVLFNNSSFYDPYWSIAPPIIFSFWLFSSTGEALSIRSALILVIAVFWGIRLTLNWAISWPGLGHEDWRYVSFRKKFGKFYWLVSFLAIHFFPTIIVFLCLIPAYLAYRSGFQGLNFIDLIATLSGLTAIFFEWRSDYELFTHRKSDKGNQPIQTGLWKISRHPNYFGEILFWFSMYFFALASNLSFYWIGIAPTAMLCLFLFYSIPAMEKRQLERRSEYSEVMNSVSMLFPQFPKKKKT